MRVIPGPRGGHPLWGVAGVYLAQFPDRLKVGKAKNLRARIRAHANQGATQIVAFPVHNGPNACVEANAIGALAAIGQRIGKSECFTDIPFDSAVAVVGAIAAAAREMKKPIPYVVDIEEILATVPPYTKAVA